MFHVLLHLKLDPIPWNNDGPGMKRRAPRRCATCVRRSASLKTDLCHPCYLKRHRYGEGFVGRACEGCGHTDTRTVGKGKLRAEAGGRALCGNCRVLAKSCRTIADLQASVEKGAELITALGIASPA